MRLIDFELRIRPPEPMASMRLSPVPVLPPMANGLPSGVMKLPATRLAVPASTTCDKASRMAVATSEGITRLPTSGSLISLVS
ncbi:hypothetical protein D3C73_1288990 [compost metagenome]